MIYTTEVQHMCPVAKGAYHGPAPIPEEGKWVQAKEIKDITDIGVNLVENGKGGAVECRNVKSGLAHQC